MAAAAETMAAKFELTAGTYFCKRGCHVFFLVSNRLQARLGGVEVHVNSIGPL
jgi:hypothetical protein